MSRRASGEGSISRRADGRWASRLTLPDGRRKCLYGKTQREVVSKLASARLARDSGHTLPGERLLVSSYLDQWLATTRPAVRPSTWKRYRQLMTLHVVPALGRVPLARLQPEQLERLYADRLVAGLSPRTVRHVHAVLHRALKHALQRDQIARNVADIARPPRVARKEMATLSGAQARALLASTVGDRFEALLVVALTTGRAARRTAGPPLVER